VDDPFADTVANVLGLFFTIIYMWPVTRLVKGVVEEKQLRIREGMRMMGLVDSALFCSWLGTYTLMFALTSLGITIVTAASVFSHSNKVYVFLFFFFFAMSTFGFCWLLSVFFSRAQVATTVAALFFLALFFPYFAVEGASYSTSAKTAACLSSQICFGLGAVVMAKLESSSTGVVASSASTMVDNWSYNATIGMFIADFFIYMILALYFSQVVPSEWGTQQKVRTNEQHASVHKSLARTFSLCLNFAICSCIFRRHSCSFPFSGTSASVPATGALGTS
jgi:ATP-binding cassette subfamily A (ABC1) protein 3